MGYPEYVGPGSPANPWPAGRVVGQEVRGASPACAADRCQLSEALTIMRQAQELGRRVIERHDRGSMSNAKWCDAGGHAFSERDPGRQRITVMVYNDETDSEEEESRDFCGECATKAGLLAKRKTRPDPAAELTRPVDDHG